MATYAIGDVQGCYDELVRLLQQCGFDRERDRIWFVGDLVNRGPKSLETLRFARDLGDGAVTVLGNHDLHLVTQHEGLARPRKDDTFNDVLDAPDANELIAWLRTRPMMHVEGGFAMVHAGLPPGWSIGQAAGLAREVESALAQPGYRDFLANMYGSWPARWSEDLAGWDRLRVIVNAMTRMRFCTEDGTMDFQTKGASAPPGYRPWFELRPRGETPIVCGHWSAMGLQLTAQLAALDSGCVWGGSLSALRLEDRKLYQAVCNGYRKVGDE